MKLRAVLLAAPATLGLAIYAAPALAYSEAEIIRLDAACHAGDRDACAHRDEAIHDRDHEAEWRRSHPEWYR
jgi:hypothetical protein